VGSSIATAPSRIDCARTGNTAHASTSANRTGHALAIGFNLIRYGPAIWQFRHSHEELPNDFGYDLWVVYLVWIGVVLALYPLCRWFADVKRRRNDVWLSYV
jgi:hypothetical protein